MTCVKVSYSVSNSVSPFEAEFTTRPGLGIHHEDNAIPALDWPQLRTFRFSQQDTGQRIFSLAFPSLFPYGHADWTLPRQRASQLTFHDWIVHLLRYHDGRFATHDRFRYAAFNLWMRELSSKRSRWLISKGAGALRHQNTTADDIRETLRDENPNNPLLNSIIRCASTVKGSRPFWKRRGRELSAHIRLLGKPAFFFTFSAADTQWDSLQRHLPDYWTWLHTDDEKRSAFLFRV